MHLIYDGEFSQVYFAGRLFAFNFFVKKFKEKDNYFFNGYNLEKLYRRNRALICQWAINNFLKKRILRKYLPQWSKAIGKKLLITVSKTKKTQNLDTEIEKYHLTHIEKIKELTLDLRRADFKINRKILGILKNSEIWELKKELQIINPLAVLVGRKRAINLANSLGPNSYLAHGDLQPKNIIVTKTKLEIIDFEECFVGPENWDEGFLWGNLIYRSAYSKKHFQTVVNNWINLSFGHQNFAIISVAVCMMRVSFFSTIKYNKTVTDRLLNFCRSEIKKHDAKILE